MTITSRTFDFQVPLVGHFVLTRAIYTTFRSSFWNIHIYSSASPVCSFIVGYINSTTSLSSSFSSKIVVLYRTEKSVPIPLHHALCIFSFFSPHDRACKLSKHSRLAWIRVVSDPNCSVPHTLPASFCNASSSSFSYVSHYSFCNCPSLVCFFCKTHYNSPSIQVPQPHNQPILQLVGFIIFSTTWTVLKKIITYLYTHILSKHVKALSSAIR